MISSDLIYMSKLLDEAYCKILLARDQVGTEKELHGFWYECNRLYEECFDLSRNLKNLSLTPSTTTDSQGS